MPETPHPTESSIDEDQEIVRLKTKFQIGDGPDARAETTVETIRVCSLEEDDDDGTRRASSDRDAMFADWVLEVERSADAIRDELGLI